MRKKVLDGRLEVLGIVIRGIVIVPPKRTLAPISHLNLSSNRTPVNIVSSAKYLGFVIDNELNFHEQIKQLEGKVAPSVEILIN